MNYNHGTGEPIGPRTARELDSSSLSMTERAVYQRERRLKMSSDQREKERAANRKHKAKKMAHIAFVKAKEKYQIETSKGRFEKQVRHHLSKGRSVADIAVREGWFVSDVQAAVDRIAASGN